MPTTDNFGWTTPTPDGSAGTWDEILNALAVAIDADLQDVLETAEAAIGAGGGELEGNLEVLTSDHTLVDLGTTSGTVTFDLAAGNVFKVTVNNTTTFAFSNFPASGRVPFIVIEVSCTTSNAVNWPTEVKFDTLTTYALATNGSPHVYVLWSLDGGTTIRAKYVYNKVG